MSGEPAETREPSAPQSVGIDDLAARLEVGLGSAYRLGSELARGGMGVVYRATDLRLKRDVAVKALRPELLYRADVRKRFVREAQLAASLTHPNIIPIYDVGERDELVWFVMQFVEGESVRSRVERTGPQSIEFTARVLKEVAFALAYSHARGVVHRDIKPDNVMIERATGRSIVMDFGIAKSLGTEETALTGPGSFVGSVGYMSPEQASGLDTIDGRSDLYSLGLVGHFLLTGRRVFEGPNFQAVLAKVLTQRVPSVRLVRRDVPDWLEGAIDGCTAATPGERFARAEQVIEQLSEGQKSLDVNPAARKLVRLMTHLGAASTIVGFCWMILGGPPINLYLLAAVVLAVGYLLLFQVGFASFRGVGWKEIRAALIELRRLWVEEGYWALSGIPRGITWFGVLLVLPAFIVLMIFGRYRPGHETTLHSLMMLLVTICASWGGLVFIRIFGLPSRSLFFATNPDEWHFPRWLDVIGRVALLPLWGKPAPIVEDEGVQIAFFLERDSTQAAAVAQRLSEVGIQTRVLPVPHGIPVGKGVFVNPKDEAAARETLRAWDADQRRLDDGSVV